ncbi:MAG: nickel pincer cofactor biosynthesis protein LarC [Candidatus Brocadiia bacterium]
MKLAYFDPLSGASGDMILGALVDAGASLRALRRELRSLEVDAFSLSSRKVRRGGLGARKLSVKVKGRGASHAHRGLPDILGILRRSELPQEDRDRSAAVFERLAEAEARVHDCAVEDVHFHEVGAVDAIVDIVGAVVGLRLLGVERVVCGPLRTGTGFVECEHGRLPVPAPATAELLVGFPSVGTDLEGELTTPTGAALLTTLAEEFGPRPAMTVHAVGCGAGSRERAGVPNVLRLFVGQAVCEDEADEVTVIEANLDDLSPEIAGHVVDRLLEAGALDAFLVPAYMKKSRPGVVLTAIAAPDAAPAIENIVLTETSTFGVRRSIASRRKLARSWTSVQTEYGAIRVKTGRLDGKAVQAAPEYEDCRRAALERGAPLKEVYRAALDAYRRQGAPE